MFMFMYCSILVNDINAISTMNGGKKMPVGPFMMVVISRVVILIDC